ncbi:hypothetical protein SAMN05444397_11442 [Flavobacterium aquidurense]|uniref:Abortive infection C-terminus n=1 Tax=Flavobacterium frigidimaris TaxID=262320 RepID=A0ABX4BNS3_FLAFR|nr:hypothetical protein [Flavobacterium frigidimaris]OXA77866.1 hypothetical protein B0A65_14875 [Flavobacterium frigidimaris]SDZ65327.1 hypothetical protein SAMN05444397_11442 [Flavobacterium aquidurense]
MSWVKNIVTLGNYNRLQQDERDLKSLENFFREIESNYYILIKDREAAFHLLQEEREEVIKNLAVFKNLLSKIKEISNDKKMHGKNDYISHFDYNSFSSNPQEFSVNFQGKIDEAGMNILTSIDNSFIRLEKRYKNNKKVTKGDLYAELGIVAIETVIASVSALIDLNIEVNENRKKITKASKQINNAIKKMKDTAPEVNAEGFRIIEITRVLNKHNQIFSEKFESVLSELNLYSTRKSFYNFIFNKKIEPSQKMTQNLHHLMLYASAYNTFNSSADIK